MCEESSLERVCEKKPVVADHTAGPALDGLVFMESLYSLTSSWLIQDVWISLSTLFSAS